MNPQRLIDGVVRQTTVLIAQLATSGGVRAPLSHVANQVFLDLATELERQGVSRKVSADMFGLALRGYQRRIQRLTESHTERGRSLWEAVLAYISEGSVVRTRSQVLSRFAHDDEPLVRAVLHDLTESGLLFASGSDTSTAYRAATPEELGALRDLSQDEGLDELVWLTVFREGPISDAALRQRVLPHGGDLDAVLMRLSQGGRLRRLEGGSEPSYESASFHVPLGDSAGWAAAVLDHFQAMVMTLCAKLNQSATASERDETGGSTYTFVIWPGHPFEAQVRRRLSDFRRDSSELRSRIDAYNREHGIPRHHQDVISYAGQCVMARDNQE